MSLNNPNGINILQGGKEIRVGSEGKITPASGTQPSHVADVTITTDLTGVDTGTDMTAAQAAQIEADLASLRTAVNALIAANEGAGIVASS